MAGLCDRRSPKADHKNWSVEGLVQRQHGNVLPHMLICSRGILGFEISPVLPFSCVQPVLKFSLADVDQKD